MKKKSFLMTAVATLGFTAATMAQVPSYVPSNGLVGWWPFNGNSNDESGNGNNGTVNGATLTMDRFGNLNAAYYFNGGNSAIILNPTLGNFGQSDFTISAWILDTSQVNGGAIVSKRNAFGSGNYFSIDWINSPGFEIDETNFSNYVTNTLPGTFLNAWHNYLFIRDSLTLSIYLDGFLQSQTLSPTVQNFSNSVNSTFGARYNNSTLVEYFKGQIDDIGIWNRALTQQEITDLYNGNICYQNITVTDTLLINMGITGFNPVTYNNTIKIFPNPTNDHITIDYGNFANMNGYQMRIENSLSQEVFQTSITQQSDYLNLTTWGGNGLYFVHIVDPQGNTIDIRKIVLK
jgi:hypothetical protein